jgi:1,4-alpha-glucan branching enzyme
MSRDRGELALLLHTHMPYVEGFGTWPFGEEWLWEAMATCYLPLLDVLDRGAPVTLSLTPVLCDQLEAPGAGERFLTFLREVRAVTHAQDLAGVREGGRHDLAAELEASAADYRAAEERFLAVGGDLLGALAPYAAWTSSATHAVLPLLATDAAVRLQVEEGIASHRARFGDWGGGFWLPECGHEPWLDALLRDAGVRSACVDLTDVLDPLDHMRPLAPSGGGLALLPIDRATIELVWSDAGYPAHGGYRDYHRHTVHHHRPWSNDGGTYDRGRARALAREHAADFVARTRARLDAAREHHGRPGLCVCAIDTELLGHWWHEGLWWLDAVLDEAAAQGLALTRLDDALERHEPAPAPELAVTTWGTPRDLSTWSGPGVADVVWRARELELRVAAAGPAAGARALRELLALQSSDWAFLLTRGLAGDYPRERVRAHAQALEDALRLGSGAPAELRNLAPWLTAPGLPES